MTPSEMTALILDEGLIGSAPVSSVLRSIDRMRDSDDIRAMSTRDESEISVRMLCPTTKAARLIQLVGSVGWFPSVTILPGGKKEKFTWGHTAALEAMTGEAILVFEPKYDLTVNFDQRFLYHVTRQRAVARIMRQGLVPRSGAKLSDHPERVYLALSVPGAMSMMLNFRRLDAASDHADAYALLRIDRTKVGTLYRDGNYAHGVYTPNGIPPDAITVMSRVQPDLPWQAEVNPELTRKAPGPLGNLP